MQYNIVGRIIQGWRNWVEELGGLGLSPLYKYHAALTMHRYTLIEQSNILIEQST